MTREPSIPLDGAAEVLADAARLHGLRVTTGRVWDAVEGHPRPGTMAALLDAARALGLDAHAEDSRPEALGRMSPEELPAILCFGAGPVAGFALLEGIEDGGYRIRDRRYGSRVLSRAELDRIWTGSVLRLRPGTPALTEPRYGRRRLREKLLGEWQLRSELAGRRGSARSRWTLAVMGFALLLMSIIRLDPSLRLVSGVLVGACVMGLAASIGALRVSQGASSALCGSGRVDCGRMLSSDWASVGGVSLAGMGVALFAASLLLLAVPAVTASPAPLWVVGAALLAGAPVSALLIGVQIRAGQFCALCLIVHAAVLGGGGFGLWSALAFARPAPPALELLAAALFGATLLLLLLSAAVPHLARAAEADALAERHERLSKLASGTLADLQSRAPLPISGESLGVRLTDGDSPHTLIALLHPECSICAPIVEALPEFLREHGSIATCFVGVPPLDEQDPADRAICEAIVAVGLAAGPEALVSALRAAKERGEALQQDPDALGTLAGDACADLGRVRDALGEARARVMEAARVKRNYTEGVPGLFFDGRRVDAPLEHIAAWLGWPALLEPLRADRKDEIAVASSGVMR